MYAIVLVALCWSSATARVMEGGHIGRCQTQEQCGDESNATPLLLTPYITKNDLGAGRQAASVAPLLGNLESYSGFFTVNETTNSNMFFWFFPAESDPENAPVILWLQGGPGSSSLTGLFYENGPYTIMENFTLKERCYRWTRTMNMIYIDNPVGTGFSFTGDESGYVTDEIDVAPDLYNALDQFFTLFPSYRTNPFFIAGESYAGKYIPVLGYYIHTHNPTAPSPINLQGIVIGSGLVDPKNMLNYSHYLYQHGLVDNLQLKKLQQIESETLKEIESENWEAASEAWKNLMWTILKKSAVSLHNYLKDSYPIPTNLHTLFNNWDLRQAIHVGNAIFHDDGKVLDYCSNDYSKSVVSSLEVLINNYRVVLYNGQLDIINAYPLTLNFVQQMKWNGSEEYEKSERVLWYVNDKLAGFAKSGGNFTEVLVRNAGHFVPTDQPLYAYDLITRVVQGIPFDVESKIEPNYGLWFQRFACDFD